MKLSAQNRPDFERCIDEGYGTETSIVSRYRNAVQFSDDAETDLALKECLLASSIREGVRIVQLFAYKGVSIHVLDESSWMATGSLKSIDGCLTTSFCRMEGIDRIAFESGGNSGSALTRYGRHAGQETFFFCPLENIDLLDSKLFDNLKTHLVGVEDRGQVKALTELFVKSTGTRHVPDKTWRYSAAMFRGLFILEDMLQNRAYDWISQTVSAGFGPIGIYKVLNSFQPDLPGLPSFLGIQQEANCPMYEAWKPDSVDSSHKAGSEQRLLTRVMYDSAPQTYQTFTDLEQLLLLSRGDLLTINRSEFAAHIYEGNINIVDLLRSQGIQISLRSGEVIEKTGLIALAGTLKAIDNGTITAGSTVLCCLTSGVCQADGAATPELVVRNDKDVLDYAGHVNQSRR